MLSTALESGAVATGLCGQDCNPGVLLCCAVLASRSHWGGVEPDRGACVSHDSGLGHSKDAVAPAPVGQPAPAAFLKAVSEALCLGPAVVISPSLSGMYSLPFLLEHSQLFKAYVPVAPICTEKFTAEQYAQIKVRPGRALGRSGN